LLALTYYYTNDFPKLQVITLADARQQKNTAQSDVETVHRADVNRPKFKRSASKVASKTNKKKKTVSKSTTKSSAKSKSGLKASDLDGRCFFIITFDFQSTQIAFISHKIKCNT